MERVRPAKGHNITDETRREALLACTATYAQVQEVAEQLAAVRSEHSHELKKWRTVGVDTDALKRAIKDRAIEEAATVSTVREYILFRSLQDMPTVQQSLLDVLTGATTLAAA